MYHYVVSQGVLTPAAPFGLLKSRNHVNSMCLPALCTATVVQTNGRQQTTTSCSLRCNKLTHKCNQCQCQQQSNGFAHYRCPQTSQLANSFWPSPAPLLPFAASCLTAMPLLIRVLPSIIDLYTTHSSTCQEMNREGLRQDPTGPPLLIRHVPPLRTCANFGSRTTATSQHKPTVGCQPFGTSKQTPARVSAPALCHVEVL